MTNYEPIQSDRKKQVIALVAVLAVAAILIGLLVYLLLSADGFSSTLRQDTPNLLRQSLPTTLSTETTAETIPTDPYYVTANSGLNVRTGAGTAYDRIGHVPSGATVGVVEWKDGWAHVLYEGLDGWCSGDYLAPVE